jgi:hypothetical protein
MIDVLSIGNISMDAKTISEALRELRSVKKMSQEAFANKVINMKALSVGRYERTGKVPPEVLVKLVQIAKDWKRPDLAAIFEIGAARGVALPLRLLILDLTKRGEDLTSEPEAVDHLNRSSRKHRA